MMARGPTYHVAFRRRREGKTDYKARKALILSRLPRVVTRGSLRNMTVQITEATITGDKVIAAANSQELKKLGWKANFGNIPSAYLTGLLCGKKAASQRIKTAIADIGLHQPTKQARVFASLKGVVDAGVNVPHKPDRPPDEKRITGQHIVDYAESLMSTDDEIYQRRFSQYLKRKLHPEKLTDHFKTVKKKIMQERRGAKAKKTIRRKGGRRQRKRSGGKGSEGKENKQRSRKK